MYTIKLQGLMMKILICFSYIFVKEDRLGKKFCLWPQHLVRITRKVETIFGVELLTETQKIVIH
uniref:Putative ovule protein n=1 Tax=Solanum chacoense TaxID=4108 RepID=A0A0V0GWG6_SOLCH